MDENGISETDDWEQSRRITSRLTDWDPVNFQVLEDTSSSCRVLSGHLNLV